jgi:O-antigen ligase
LIAWLWPDPYQLRAAFPVLNHSHFAAFVELALAPAVWAAMQGPGENLGFRGPQANSHGKPDPFHTWAAAAMVCAVWAVGSRSGSAIVMVEVAGVILLSARFAPPGGFPWRRALTIILPALVLVTGIGLQGLATRLAEPPRDDLRLIFARAAIGMVQARPLSGFGLGSFAAVYPAYEPEDVGLYVEHAHDDWLEWGAEGGLALPALFLALAVLALRRSFARPWYLGIVAVFVQAALEFPLHNSAIAAWQFAALGCAAARPVYRSSTRTL